VVAVLPDAPERESGYGALLDEGGSRCQGEGVWASESGGGGGLPCLARGVSGSGRVVVEVGAPAGDRLMFLTSRLIAGGRPAGVVVGEDLVLPAGERGGQTDQLGDLDVGNPLVERHEPAGGEVGVEGGKRRCRGPVLSRLSRSAEQRRKPHADGTPDGRHASALADPLEESRRHPAQGRCGVRPRRGPRAVATTWPRSSPRGWPAAMNHRNGANSEHLADSRDRERRPGPGPSRPAFTVRSRMLRQHTIEPRRAVRHGRCA
jgi:hypothetical protein